MKTMSSLKVFGRNPKLEVFYSEILFKIPGFDLTRKYQIIHQQFQNGSRQNNLQRILLSYVKLFVCLIERPFTTEYQLLWKLETPFIFDIGTYTTVDIKSLVD
jgi:hypothetical protein